MPEFRPVRSSVTPEGTATEERMMVEQDVLDLLAEEAPLEPLKVHVVARLARSGAAVGTGAASASAMGTAITELAIKATTRYEINMFLFFRGTVR